MTLLGAYLRDIRNFSLLKKQEEKLLLKEYQKTKDPKILERLISSNLRFVVSVALKYQNRQVPLTDLISAGNLGLIEAIQKFDAVKYSHLRLISFAVHIIRMRILNLVYEDRLMHIPRNRLNRLLYKDLTDEQALAEGQYQLSSIHHPDVAGYVDKVRSVDSDAATIELTLDVKKMARLLTPKERQAVRLVFFENLSLDAAGYKMKLSRERVRQLKKRALKKLKIIKASKHGILI